MADLELVDPVLDGYDRGLPADARGLRLSEAGLRGWKLHTDLETPIATIRSEHLRHNARLMQRWCREHGAELWPHAKTTMSPQLVDLQLRTGADGITAATAAQAELLLASGVRRVLVANQLVQSRPLSRLLKTVAHSGQEVVCYVDSVEGTRLLDEAAHREATLVDVLLEIGAPGARSGIRDESGMHEVLEALATAPNVRLIGVAGYEGSFGADRSADSLDVIDAFLARQAQMLTSIVEDGRVDAETPVFSAGGSMFFDRVELARRKLSFEHRLVLRSGCYLLHDAGLFERATPLPEQEGEPGLRAALTVWGTVHSRPEPKRAFLDVGRRDVGEDQGLPRALRRVPVGTDLPVPAIGLRVLQLNDQHCHLDLDAGSPLQVGDRIELSVSHPCTTMDKWRIVPLINDGDYVEGVVSTRF